MRARRAARREDRTTKERIEALRSIQSWFVLQNAYVFDGTDAFHINLLAATNLYLYICIPVSADTMQRNAKICSRLATPVFM